MVATRYKDIWLNAYGINATGTAHHDRASHPNPNIAPPAKRAAYAGPSCSVCHQTTRAVVRLRLRSAAERTSAAVAYQPTATAPRITA